MGNLFGTPDTGPSEEQLRQDRIAEAKKRARQFEQAAEEQSKKGPQLLFGPGNPALRTGGNGGNSNAN